MTRRAVPALLVAAAAFALGIAVPGPAARPSVVTPAAPAGETLPKLKHAGQVGVGYDPDQRFRGRRDAGVVGGYFVSHELQAPDGTEYLDPLVWLDRDAATDVMVGLYVWLAYGPRPEHPPNPEETSG